MNEYIILRVTLPTKKAIGKEAHRLGYPSVSEFIRTLIEKHMSQYQRANHITK